MYACMYLPQKLIRFACLVAISASSLYMAKFHAFCPISYQRSTLCPKKILTQHAITSTYMAGK